MMAPAKRMAKPTIKRILDVFIALLYCFHDAFYDGSGSNIHAPIVAELTMSVAVNRTWTAGKVTLYAIVYRLSVT